MGESKHTPGPWHLYRVGDISALCPADAHGTSLLTVVDEGEASFAAVYHEADARLIAAAPDLYSELRGALCPRPANHRPDQFEVGQCVDAGECGCSLGAAILKAEGRK